MRIDAGLVAVAALLGALFCLDAQRVSVLDLVVGVVASAALLVRRRWPVPVAGLLIASTALSAAGMGATAIAVGAVAHYRSWRVTVAVVAAHAALVIPLFALAAGSTRDFVQGSAVLLALDVAAVATGLLVRSLRERAHETEVRQWLLVEEARHAERERIAREMHDVLAHRISLLAMHAGALEVRRSAPEDERRAAGVVRQCAFEALEDLRAVIGMLREDGMDDADRPQPTLTDLPELIEQARQAGTTITFDGPLHDLAALPDAVGRHVYRVVQEGLTNARKHAPGAPVRVRLGGGEGSYEKGGHEGGGWYVGEGGGRGGGEGGGRGGGEGGGRGGGEGGYQDGHEGGDHAGGGQGSYEGGQGGYEGGGRGGDREGRGEGGSQGSGDGGGRGEGGSQGRGDGGGRGEGGNQGGSDGGRGGDRHSSGEGSGTGGHEGGGKGGGYEEGGEDGDRELVVEITNPASVNEAAVAALPGTGSGLMGLGERMDLVGGQLEFGRTPEGLFRLAARVPWRP